MLNEIDAVIFDLDGTLVDSMWMWRAIDIEYLSTFGIELPQNLQKEIEGMSFSETAIYFKERFGITDSIEVIKKQWNQMAYEKYKNEVPLKKGALFFLKYLKEQKIKTGIATSNSIELVQTVLNAHQLGMYFDEIHTACEVKKGKPEPDIYLLVAKELEVKPSRCLIFEDITTGLMAGIRAGMKSCAIYDYHSRDEEEEKRKMADFYIKDYEEVFNNKYN